MCRLTIHTATYNRAYILPAAYESLRNQTVKDFEWIITDDGSTDNTAELVSRWISECQEFPIVYNGLSHVGIPRALNSGVNLAKTDWFMMLDSDDHLKPDTVEKVLGWLGEIERDDTFAGIGFARCYPNGDYMKPQVPAIDSQLGYVDATHLERSKYNLDMDMCEVHRVSLFKKYPFQYWPTEHYAPEQLNFYQIALQGLKLRWRSDKLYICDYLPDGQTRDDRLVKNNPMGFAMMYNQNLLFQKSCKDQLRNAMRMTALCFYAGNMDYLKNSNSKAATVISFPAGILLGFRRMLQYSRMQ